MFGRKKKTQEDDMSDLAALGIDVEGLMGDPVEDGDDGDLEAELAALQVGGGGKVAKKKPKPQPKKELDLNALTNVGDEEIDDTFTEEDMNDPELLAALGELGGDPTPQKTAPSPQKQAPAPAPAPRPATVAGNPVAPPRPVVAPRPSSSAPAPAPKPQAPPTQSAAEKQMAVVKARQNDYKKAAIACKKAGDNAGAIEFMKVYKSFSPLFEQLEIGLEISMSKVPPPPSEWVPPTAADPTPAESAPKRTSTSNSSTAGPTAAKKPTVTAPPAEAVMPKEELDKYSKYENQLIQQSNECVQHAKTFKASGDMVNAVNLMKLKKTFDTALVNTRNRKTAGLTCPKFTETQFSFATVSICEDLKADQLELTLSKCAKLGDKPFDSFLTCELPYPSSEKPQEFKTSGLRNAVEGDAAFKEIFTIGRNNAFMRVAKRGNIEIKLHQKKSFGRTALLGAARIPIKEFDSQCVIAGNAQFLVNRKPTGATVQFEARMREPLGKAATKADSIVNVSWLMYNVDQENTKAAKPPAQPKPKPAVQPKVQTSKSATPAQPANKPVPEEEDTTGDPDNIQDHVSNAVLEWEMTQAQQKMLTYKKKGEPVPEILVDNLAMAETKINMLVLQIQLGKLSMEDYMKMLKNKIKEEKKLAIMLKKKGKMDWAKAALTRAKIMQNEVDEVEGAGGGEEGEEPDEEELQRQEEEERLKQENLEKIRQQKLLKQEQLKKQQEQKKIQEAKQQEQQKQQQQQQEQEYDPNNVMGHVSNAVLEQEIENAKREILTLRKKGEEVPDYLTDKISQAESKINILVIQIQLGKLTMEDYLQGCKDKILEEKKLAIKFKKEGQIDWAKAALTRAKIMQNEVDEVENAQ